MLSRFASLKPLFNKLYKKWMVKRLPSSQKQILNQRRLFIFPTLQGLGFLVVCALVLIAAVNYENNLAYIVVFFMLSLFNTAILFTFKNLSGLQLEANNSDPGFEGEHVGFKVKLVANSKSQHHQVFLSFKSQIKTTVTLMCKESKTITLLASASHRGLVRADRVRIESTYPLGFIRCWSWIDLDMQALVYPKPIVCDANVFIGSADEGREHGFRQGDDFHGLRAYQFGDSLTQSYWPSLAKGQALQQKQYRSFQSQDHSLNFDNFHQGNLELTLSHICYVALQLNKKNEAFSLMMPSTQLTLSSGEKHLHQVLKALAMHH